jgi:hypothetical protein
MSFNNEIEEYIEPRRVLTIQQRVANFRAKDRINFKKTIEVKLSVDECAILDAIASQQGMSRVLLASTILKTHILSSPYFISGGKLCISK